MRNNLAVFIITLFVSVTVSAGEWTGYSTVKRLYPHITEETIFVQLNAVTINPGDTCSSSDWYAINATDLLSKEIFSLLLASQKSQSSVRMYIDGCRKGRPKIIAVHDQ